MRRADAVFDRERFADTYHSADSDGDARAGHAKSVTERGDRFHVLGLTREGSWQPGGSPILDCPAAEAAVLVAVAGLGYPAQSVTIRPYGFTCGDPFGSGKMACLYITRGPVAYVRFVGTNKVAALTIALDASGQMVASVVAFEVPPAGWSMP